MDCGKIRGMKLGLVVLCAAMVGLGVAQAATYSDMAVDVYALPKEKRFIRELVLSRVWARTPPSAGGRVSSATEVDAQERVPPKRLFAFPRDLPRGNFCR